MKSVRLQSGIPTADQKTLDFLVQTLRERTVATVRAFWNLISKQPCKAKYGSVLELQKSTRFTGLSVWMGFIMALPKENSIFNLFFLRRIYSYHLIVPKKQLSSPGF